MRERGEDVMNGRRESNVTTRILFSEIAKNLADIIVNVRFKKKFFLILLNFVSSYSFSMFTKVSKSDLAIIIITVFGNPTRTIVNKPDNGGSPGRQRVCVLGVPKMSIACRTFVVCTQPYTHRPRFRPRSLC